MDLQTFVDYASIIANIATTLSLMAAWRWRSFFNRKKIRGKKRRLGVLQFNKMPNAPSPMVADLPSKASTWKAAAGLNRPAGTIE